MRWRWIPGVWLVALVGAHASDPSYHLAQGLSVAEKKERSSTELGEMKETLQLSLARLQEAKDRNDIMQVNCVAAKLDAIRGLLKLSEEAWTNLVEAIAQRDDDLIDHEFTKIALAGIRVDGFRAEVEGCVGEASQYIGGTVMESSIDGDIRSDDPTGVVEPPLPPLEVEQRPPPNTVSE